MSLFAEMKGFRKLLFMVVKKNKIKCPVLTVNIFLCTQTVADQQN